MNQFLEKATKIQDFTVKNRRYFHENAESGRDLPLTTRYIMDRLTEMGLEPKEICNSGVSATIYGKKPGKTILLRGDTDALPMGEDNNLSFRTTTTAAHTCGHDMHTAMLLSAASILKDMTDELEGNVKLMFQPAEEVFDGAQKMIQAGLLENPKVDAAMALHTMLDTESPSLGYSEGNMTSSCDGFKITITGSGCHGAAPHTGIDPINAGTHLYQAFQGLVAREVPPPESVSLTFGQFSAGNSNNIIPQTAILQGTLRTYNPDVRKKLVARMHEICKGTEVMFGVQVDYEVLSALPSIYSDPTLLHDMIAYIKDLDDKIIHLSTYKVTPSDDFAFVSLEVPSIFLMLGCKEKGCPYPHHNPGVIFDENAMIYGVAIHVQCAYNWLKDHN